jgi:DNA-directed RNA polymerase specialized sigma24 family protein
MDAGAEKLREVLRALARGADAWRDFLDLFGPFIMHILKEDYALYEEYDAHSREEVLHDIYLRAARYAGRLSKSKTTPGAYRAYLRRIIKTVMSGNGRILRRWRREISLERAQEAGFQAPANPGFNPLRWLENRWRTKSIIPAARAAIGKVAGGSRDPARTAYILERRLLAEDPYADIAEAAGMEVDAVRHVVHYYRDEVVREVRDAMGVKLQEEQGVASVETPRYGRNEET